ncbi:hypothetical protein F2Q70_00020748 [Brassica cretica]|uniref:Transposase MuDR plant domain-containing protein n=1 Tax=Brassica cretica TaxID=69181 RepID=A0A8S9GSX8_BRACR|nr:hypothetical protein F2Q70_00020748 [Brassica cretica]
MSQHSCGDQILVERRKNKQANVEAASGDDIGNVAGCAEMDVDKGKGNDYDVGEDEDDGNYDYNYWHEFVRKDCETDEDDDFEGCPPKRRRGGRSDLNGYERCGARVGRGQGSGKPASELTDDQRDILCTSRIVAYTEETDISLGIDVVHATPAKDRNQPNHEENSVYRRLTESTSGTVRCALTFETGTVETVDVVAVTPPQQNKKHNRVIEDDDEFVDPSLTETAKVCNSTRASDETHFGESVVNVLVSPQKQYKNKTFKKDTWESDDAVLVTPPKQYNKHNRVIEADDEFVDPPLPETAKVCNSTSASDETHSGVSAVNGVVEPLKQYKNHSDEKETGESEDAVLVTPPKQYNKHNCVIEADDDFVDPPVLQTTDFDGGEAFTPGKHFPSTSVFEDDDLFVDPPVTEGIEVQGGEAFMIGIQVSEMYGYDDVVPVFNDMEGSGFQPQDIDYIKEESDIYVGRMHCKRFVTAKRVDKQCSWRVMAKQLGDSPTYVVKKAILGRVCTAEANVEAASGDDIGNVAGCAEMDVDKGKGNDYDVGEDEDDGDYDYNDWHEFVRKYCETDEDDDFEGCPPKGRRGGRSDLNGYERCGARGGRGQGSGKPASELTDDQRDILCTSRIVAYTEETDISLGVDVVHATPAKDRNQPNHEENSVYRRLTKSTSGTVRCALTFETGTVETVDVVTVTPPQKNKKHNRVIEDDDEFVDPSLTKTAKYKNKTFKKDTWESDDAVLVTPPKQYNKHNRVIEADDEFVDPPLPETAKVCNSTSASDETHSGVSAVNGVVEPLKQYKNHSDEKETRESEDAVLVTPLKQYNKHNCVIEADGDFVDPPVIQTTEFDGGEAFTPGKHFPSTSVFEDDDLFVDPPVTEGIEVQGGEAFMKGIQVSEMYGYDDVVPVFNDMEGNGFQPQDIDYIKEESDIYVGRMFKDKAQFKLSMSIYALAKVCRFKFRHCKRFVTAKCVNKHCSWRVMAKQLGDSPTYVVKKAILGRLCTAEVQG